MHDAEQRRWEHTAFIGSQRKVIDAQTTLLPSHTRPYRPAVVRINLSESESRWDDSVDCCRMALQNFLAGGISEHPRALEDIHTTTSRQLLPTYGVRLHFEFSDVSQAKI